MKINLMRALLWLCLAIQATFFVLAWGAYLPAIGSMTITMSANGMSMADQLALTPGQRLVGAALALPALAALGFGLWRLDRLLLNFRRHELFTARSIGHLRAFAGAMLASTLLAIAEIPARTLALGAMGAVGGATRHLAVGVNSEQLMLILVSGLFYLITRLMQEGRRLSEENEGFV